MGRGRKEEATGEKKKRNETLGAGYTSTLDAGTLEAILIPYRQWCMVCHDGSNSRIPGLKLA